MNVMKHLGEDQIRECLCGDAGMLTRFLRFWHLRHCPSCAEKACALRAELEDQRSLGAELRSIQKLVKEADSTLTVPKAPDFSKDS